LDKNSHNYDKKCRTYILGIFFGFGGPGGNPFGKPQENCKKAMKTTKIKILNFLGVKSKFWFYPPPHRTI